MNEHTILASVKTTGIGIHSGKNATVRLWPAETGSGILFVRKGSGTISAHHSNARPFLRATCLESGGARVYTVEHLLAALYGLGIGNLRVEVDAEELPILDGSSQAWMDLVCSAGIVDQGVSARELRLKRTMAYRSGNAEIIVHPAAELSIAYTVLIGGTAVQRVDELGSSFGTGIAAARTYCLASDVADLKSRGLLGGIKSMAGFVALDEPHADPIGSLIGMDATAFVHQAEPFDVLSFVPPRFPDEMARHKILDVIGDFSLLGARLCFRIEAKGSGHSDNHAVLRKLLNEPDALAWFSHKEGIVT